MFAQCPTCGEVFTLRRRGHTFCSIVCGQRARERERRGLNVSDDRSSREVLTAADVVEIHKARKLGLTLVDIAKAWGVSPTTIWRKLKKENQE